ncbi:pseudouridine synthase [Cereibacter sphaeroides]|uniref:pseudouridine synthase n=1 Tax=Cereibacter sphaeroides TaxID=1063 RepID=UPI001F48FB38|nr:pseudouridine synthase [Cereibacter sphaeroides]MCE6961356.1 pseudouridine synthase [Cereibacter sphaeroides]MCE6973963.1 pseudouridine synthase [Cereibacter sphaeroides]
MTDSKDGERIAKVLSRAGVASRRDAERMIELGRVAVNGRVIDSPALNVTPKDRITVDGQPLAAAEPARLWLYYKPEGLVTSASDEKGRETVFDHLPEDLPRVMSVGRLDLNSEGLLLLTNDGELKRRLELPSTGWLRKYRVRVKGNPADTDLEPLRKGITVEGEAFQPMTVTLDRLQGANAWLTVGLREGKNREIRRAMTAIGLTVNRLIRISYGPFRLGELQPGDVEEVRPRVLRDQLGLEGAEPAADPRATRPAAKASPRGAKATAAGLGGKPPGVKRSAGPAMGGKGAPGAGAASGATGRSRPGAGASRATTSFSPPEATKDARPGRGPKPARPTGTSAARPPRPNAPAKSSPTGSARQGEAAAKPARGAAPGGKPVGRAAKPAGRTRREALPDAPIDAGPRGPKGRPARGGPKGRPGNR